MDNSARINYPNIYSSLYWAVAYNRLDVAGLLLSRGAEVEPDNSPLSIAIFTCNSLNIYECKRKWKEDQENDCTFFLQSCNPDLIELLLANGADPGDKHLTRTMFANNEKAFQLLLKYGVDVNMSISVCT